MSAPSKQRAAMESSNAAMPAPAPHMSFDEACAHFDGEWVVMQVTAFDQDRWPSYGYVIAHDRSHGKVYKRLEKAYFGPREPDTCFYVFHAAPYCRTGDEVREALERAWQEGDQGAWRRW